jgi:hypothetical protein
MISAMQKMQAGSFDGLANGKPSKQLNDVFKAFAQIVG